MALTTLKELLDGSFRSAEKAAAFLRVPVLGDIGVFDPTWPRVFRHLRARLLALNGGRSPRVITVSSVSRSDEKTSFALNLAATLREVDPGRVLVVGSDPMNPALEEMANVRARTGLIDILQHALDLRRHVYETAVPGLDIIPVGRLTAAPELERLLHQGCSKLLEKLLLQYSFIIIDTPPVPAATLASTVGRHSDGLILVAELGANPRYAVAAALDDVAASGVAVLGCVFMAPSSKRKGRLFRTVAIVGSVILLCVLTATLAEGFAPGSLGECVVWLKQLVY